MGNPPAGVKLTMECVCILQKVKPVRKDDPDKLGAKINDYWEPGKKLLNDPQAFLNSLFAFDKENMEEATIKQLTPYIEQKNGEFTPAASLFLLSFLLILLSPVSVCMCRVWFLLNSLSRSLQLDLARACLPSLPPLSHLLSPPPAYPFPVHSASLRPLKRHPGRANQSVNGFKRCSSTTT